MHGQKYNKNWWIKKSNKVKMMFIMDIKNHLLVKIYHYDNMFLMAWPSKLIQRKFFN